LNKTINGTDYDAVIADAFEILVDTEKRRGRRRDHIRHVCPPTPVIIDPLARQKPGDHRESML
jgi:hypothetical protein